MDADMLEKIVTICVYVIQYVYYYTGNCFIVNTFH